MRKIEFYQRKVDEFYLKNGKCCAGCDHWRFFNSYYGDCSKSKLVSSEERMSIIGITNLSSNIGAGHVITKRDFMCDLFEDTYDWGCKDD